METHRRTNAFFGARRVQTSMQIRSLSNVYQDARQVTTHKTIPAVVYLTVHRRRSIMQTIKRTNVFRDALILLLCMPLTETTAPKVA